MGVDSAMFAAVGEISCGVEMAGRAANPVAGVSDGVAEMAGRLL